MTRKKLVFVVMFVVILLLPCLAHAQIQDELFDYHALDIELKISNEFNIVPTSTSSYLEYASAELSWYPRDDYRQEIDYITTDPRADFDEDTGFLFEWDEPSFSNFYIEQESKLKAKNEFKKVSQKIDFPIKDLDPMYSKYIEPQQIIDINDDIRGVASSVVQGEDDLFVAVFKLAEWVELNVDYDLSTLTADASQKSSWVLDNKRGVCDEITNLFISMCRSLGIPARFVSGISYSNVNQQNDQWGPHGWAEVYFPTVGWVPFDVTYKELGFVDATHIKLKTSLDAKETSLNYASRSRNTKIEPGKLEFDVDVVDQDYKLKALLQLDAEVAESEVGFGSYNLLILNVKNLNSFYVTSRISLANVNGVEILDDNFQSIMLAPNEEKKLYWMMKVGNDFRGGFIYTFPLKLSTDRGERAETSFRASQHAKLFSEEYMKLFMITDHPEEKLYSKNVLVTCVSSKDKIYLNESVNISCVIDNKGDKTLTRLSICLDDKCSTTRIPAREAARFDYTKNFETLGVKTLVFKAENEIIKKSYYSIIEIQDKPLLEIQDLEYPKTISYEDLKEIQFFVKKKSTSTPRNVKIKLEHELIEQEWEVKTLERDYKFTVLIRGEYLKLNKNDFNILISYTDDQGISYLVQKKFTITLEDPTFVQRIMIWLNVAERKITDWINNI